MKTEATTVGPADGVVTIVSCLVIAASTFFSSAAHAVVKEKVSGGKIKVDLKFEDEAGMKLGKTRGTGKAKIFKDTKAAPGEFLVNVKFDAPGIDVIPDFSVKADGKMKVMKGAGKRAPVKVDLLAQAKDRKGKPLFEPTSLKLEGTLAVTDTPHVAGAALNLAGGNRVLIPGTAPSLYISNLFVTSIPEPATAALAGCGLLALLAATSRPRSLGR